MPALHRVRGVVVTDRERREIDEAELRLFFARGEAQREQWERECEAAMREDPQ